MAKKTIKLMEGDFIQFYRGSKGKDKESGIITCICHNHVVVYPNSVKYLDTKGKVFTGDVVVELSDIISAVNRKSK